MFLYELGPIKQTANFYVFDFRGLFFKTASFDTNGPATPILAKHQIILVFKGFILPRKLRERQLISRQGLLFTGEISLAYINARICFPPYVNPFLEKNQAVKLGVG